MPATIKLTKENVENFIRLNPRRVHRYELLSQFGKKNSDKLDSILGELIKERVIERPTKRSFRAFKPWADVAYAIVGDIPKRGRVPLEIEGVPEDINLSVEISPGQIFKNDLKKGDRIFVGLRRFSGFKLSAKFIEDAPRGKRIRLTGAFNENGTKFRPLDPEIKTEFDLGRGSHSSGRRVIMGQLVKQFDVTNPTIFIPKNQDRDLRTGRKISAVIAEKHGVARPFPTIALEEAEVAKSQHIDRSFRTDLTHLPFVTVDPVDAPDLDDAFYVEKKEDGYHVYTAIADVASVVKFGSAIDFEAQQRGVTFYVEVPDEVYHMLPNALSAQKCSLLPDADKPAIVIKQIVDWDGNLRDYDVMAAVIRSTQRLSYGEFYDCLERKDPRFQAVQEYFEARKAKMPKKNVDTGIYAPADVDILRATSKSIVETLMIDANQIIPQFLKENEMPCVFRNNGAGADPDTYKMARFQLLELGVELPEDYHDCTNAMLNRVLEEARVQMDGHRIRSIVMNTLLQHATYSLDDCGHYALGIDTYAHCTSPIRRYVDLINQRAIHSALGNGDIGLYQQQIADMPHLLNDLNGQKDREKKMRRDIDKYHYIRELQRYQGSAIHAVIMDVDDDGVDILLPHSGLRKQIDIDDLPANEWRVDVAKKQLIYTGQKCGYDVPPFSSGDKLVGYVYDITPHKAAWNIALKPSANITRELGFNPRVLRKLRAG